LNLGFGIRGKLMNSSLNDHQKHLVAALKAASNLIEQDIEDVNIWKVWVNNWSNLIKVFVEESQLDTKLACQIALTIMQYSSENNHPEWSDRDFDINPHLGLDIISKALFGFGFDNMPTPSEFFFKGDDFKYHQTVLAAFNRREYEQQMIANGYQRTFGIVFNQAKSPEILKIFLSEIFPGVAIFGPFEEYELGKQIISWVVTVQID
jgi:hypothetical protein